MTDALAAFLDEPRWLAWREEERRGRKTKVPYAATPGARGPGSSTSSATWGTHAEAKERARQLDNGSTTGCGIVLGALDGGETYLCGADLDSSFDDNRALARWAVRILTALGTYSEVSPSGRGLKAFFYIAAGLVRRFLKLLGVRPGRWGCRRSIPGLSGADHGPAVEIYCSARYFTVTGRLWSIDHQRIVHVDWPQLEALAKPIPPPSSGAAGGRGNAGGTGDNSRSAKAWRAAVELGAASYEAMCEGLRNHADPEIRAWVTEKGEAYGERELQRIWARPAALKAAQAQEFSDWERHHPPPDPGEIGPGPSAGHLA